MSCRKLKSSNFKNKKDRETRTSNKQLKERKVDEFKFVFDTKHSFCLKKKEKGIDRSQVEQTQALGAI